MNQVWHAIIPAGWPKGDILLDSFEENGSSSLQVGTREASMNTAKLGYLIFQILPRIGPSLRGNNEENERRVRLDN